MRCDVTDIVPVVAFATGLLAIATSTIIVKTQHVYVGGLVWPFVADLSRDYPSSIVCSLGLNTLALLVALAWTLNYHRHQFYLQCAWLDVHTRSTVRRWSLTCNLLGAVGACFLAFYQFGRVATAPRWLAGEMFIILELVACLINTYLSYKMSRTTINDSEPIESCKTIKDESTTVLRRVKRGVVIEIVCLVLCVGALGAYLPLFYDVEPAHLLSVEECITKRLGQHYCQDTVRLDTKYTTLRSYESDLFKYQVRAIAQLGYLLALLTYMLSFVVSNPSQPVGQVGPIAPDKELMDPSEYQRCATHSPPPASASPLTRNTHDA